MSPHRGVFENEWWSEVMTHRRGRTVRFIKNNHLVWITGWTWTSQKFGSSTGLEKLIHSLSFPLFHYTIYFLSFTQPVELEKKLLLLHLDFTCRPAGGWSWDPTKVKVKREIFLWLGSAVINSITGGGCISLREMGWLIIYQGSLNHIHVFDFCCRSNHLGRDYIFKQLNSDITSPSHM